MPVAIIDTRSGHVGITVSDSNPPAVCGVVIDALHEADLAYQAGFRIGDVITAIDGHSVAQSSQSHRCSEVIKRVSSKAGVVAIAYVRPSPPVEQAIQLLPPKWRWPVGVLLLAALASIALPMVTQWWRTCARIVGHAAVSAPGDISATMQRILRDYPQYKPRALSSDPWVVQLHDFLTDAESDAFVELCLGGRSMVQKMELSAGHTDSKTPGVTFFRNSSVCPLTNVPGDEVSARVLRRVSQLMQLPARHLEWLQLVKYTPGQFYKIHHDQSYDATSAPGERVFSALMYLNTPPEGGGTYFNDIGLTVVPMKGSIVLWPNMMDTAPTIPELRTHHESLPVVRGTKYALNLWMHQHDFVTLHSNGCRPESRYSGRRLFSWYDPDDYLREYLEARRRAGLDDSVPFSMRPENAVPGFLPKVR